MSKIPDYCGPGGSDKRYVKQEDSFELIRRYAYEMVRDCGWTSAQASAYIEEEDAKLYAAAEQTDELPKPERSTRTPDKDNFPSRKFSQHIDEWNVPSDGINRRKF